MSAHTAADDPWGNPLDRRLNSGCRRVLEIGVATRESEVRKQASPPTPNCLGTTTPIPSCTALAARSAASSAPLLWRSAPTATSLVVGVLVLMVSLLRLLLLLARLLMRVLLLLRRLRLGLLLLLERVAGAGAAAAAEAAAVDAVHLCCCSSCCFPVSLVHLSGHV